MPGYPNSCVVSQGISTRGQRGRRTEPPQEARADYNRDKSNGKSCDRQSRNVLYDCRKQQHDRDHESSDGSRVQALDGSGRAHCGVHLTRLS